MTSSEMNFGPIWEYPHRRRRAAVLLARIAATGLGIVVVLAVATSAIVESRVEASARDDALKLAAAMSVAQRDIVPSLIVAAEVEAIVGEEDRTVAVHGDDHTRRGNNFTRWRTSVRTQAFATNSRQFTTQDPSGETWWHSTLAFRDDQLLIVGTPRAPQMELARSIQRIIIATGLASTLGILSLWALAYRVGVVPALSLVEASEDLRFRGELRPETTKRLQGVGEVPTELHTLAETFQHLERDSRQGHRQVEALLDAAGALGGSLDQSAILESTLEHLERLLGSERSAILRFDVHAKTYEVVAALGHTQDWLDDMNAAPTDPFVPTMRALRERVPVQVSNTESEVVTTSLRNRGRRHGYRSVLAVPLTDELEHPTALILHSAKSRAYSFDEIELSKSFASIAGAALRNAELFEQTDADLNQQTSRLESIVESVEQGLIVEGSDGRVVYANGAVRHLLPAALRPPEGLLTAEVIDAVLDRGAAPSSMLRTVEELGEGANHWLDVDLVVGDQPTTFRLRKFVVRNSHGVAIGRGQTWTDVSRDRELDRMKSGLLAAVSHEFRSPLALIKGYATTLLADDVEWTFEDQRHFLSLVSSEADRLTGLVQRLLDMRRIDAGMISLQVMPVRLDVLLDSVRDGLPHEADRIVIGPLPQITVDVDAVRISTAVRNLVDNACKYSPPSEPVTITAEVSDEMVEIIVRDAGPGVDPAIRDHLFDTFVRGETGLAAMHSGVGLGLALSRGFVEAHQGRLYLAESEAEGAEFRLELPLAKALVAQEPAR